VSGFANVVRAELFKLLRKRRTYVLAGLWWGLLPALALIGGRLLYVNVALSPMARELGGIVETVQAVASPFGLARIALVGPAYMSPTFYIIVVALLAAMLIGEERGHAMWKTVLVAQPQRVAVIAGKVTVAMLALGALMAGAALSGAAFGAFGTTFLPTDWSGEWASLAGLFALQWAFSLAAVLFAFLMVFVLKNVALGVVTVFLLPALLEGLYTIYRATVGFQPLNRLNVLFQAIQLQQRLEAAPRYFFTSNLYAPARAPVNELVASFSTNSAAQGVEVTPDFFGQLLGINITLPHAAGVMAGYALVFGLLLFWRFSRHDVD
jgi:ABC-type transport system involved in multi-copper enzyme maturation permease subunit